MSRVMRIDESLCSQKTIDGGFGCDKFVGEKAGVSESSRRVHANRMKKEGRANTSTSETQGGTHRFVNVVAVPRVISYRNRINDLLECDYDCVDGEYTHLRVLDGQTCGNVGQSCISSRRPEAIMAHQQHQYVGEVH